MKASLKILTFFSFILFTAISLADTSFKIPRTTVVELKETSTGREYPLFIKFPKSYNSKPLDQYPVIYLTDAWYSFQIVSGATRFPMNSGAMEEAIIVAVSYSKGSRGSSSRFRDYTPIKEPSWKMETGNAEGHAKFIKDIVFPYIESNYRAQSNQRTFVGNSLGGLFGAYILFHHSDMFSSYILGSPSVWFKNDYLLSVPVNKIENPLKVYISVGKLETPKNGEGENMVEGAKMLASKIQSLENPNIDLKLSTIEGATHETAFPTTAIQGLNWIYGKK